MKKISKQTKGNMALSLAIIIMVILFYASSMPYQQQSAVPLLQQWFFNKPFEAALSSIVFLYGGQEISIAANGYAGFIEFFIRKGAHFASFLLLGYCWHYALKQKMKETMTPMLIAILICICYAAFDEFHQSLTPNRTPLLADIILDSVGAIVGVGLVYLKKR